MATPITTTDTNATSSPANHPTKGGLSRRVLKVTGLFSGVQTITILCSIIRTKLVAILLGPTGIGLFGIYNSVIDTISSISQVGTGAGEVRAIAMSPRKNLPRLIAIMRRWSLALGLLGSMVMLCLSPYFSQWSFGDYDHIIPFVLLSGGILLNTLSNNEGAIFQGLKHYTKLAKSTVTGAVIGLMITVPMFFYWGMASIIPAILTYIIIAWICRGLYRERIEKPDSKIGLKETLITGKEFVILGIFITVSQFAANAVSYIFMSYLNRVGGIEIAGFYQAGFTLVNRYIGLVLGAIGTEYFPRIAEVSNSSRRLSVFLAHEIAILMLMIFPIITLFLATDELIIHLLYDGKFLVMLPFITWAIIGTVFRTWSWCYGFIILAKGDGIMFLITELISAFIAVALNIFFYDWRGIAGLGYAYTIWYVLYLIEVLIVCRWRYGIAFNRNSFVLSLTVFVICWATAIMRARFGWVATLPFVAISLIVSLTGLKRLLGISLNDIVKKFAKPAKKG
jgi:PST family polysaccharide transporter